MGSHYQCVVTTWLSFLTWWAAIKVFITIMFLLRGVTKAVWCPLMICFQKKSSYPISGLVDNVPGTFYRTRPKGLMDRRVFVGWVMEPRVLGKLLYGHTSNFYGVYIHTCNFRRSHNRIEFNRYKNSIFATKKDRPLPTSGLIYNAKDQVFLETQMGWKSDVNCKDEGMDRLDEWVS